MGMNVGYGLNSAVEGGVFHILFRNRSELPHPVWLPRGRPYHPPPLFNSSLNPHSFSPSLSCTTVVPQVSPGPTEEYGAASEKNASSRLLILSNTLPRGTRSCS
jgi:hypothetical protein